MIVKIKKILYTTDLSDNFDYTFQYALNSAEQHNAKIDVLNVLKPKLIVPGMTIDEINVPPDQMAEFVKEKIDDLLYKEIRYKPERAHLVSSIEVIEGDPVDGILQKAREEKPDVIIMGKHSKGKLARALLGSVAMNVLRQTRVPVYIIPLPDH